MKTTCLFGVGFAEPRKPRKPRFYVFFGVFSVPARIFAAEVHNDMIFGGKCRVRGTQRTTKKYVVFAEGKPRKETRGFTTLFYVFFSWFLLRFFRTIPDP